MEIGMFLTKKKKKYIYLLTYTAAYPVAFITINNRIYSTSLGCCESEDTDVVNLRVFAAFEDCYSRHEHCSLNPTLISDHDKGPLANWIRDIVISYQSNRS